MPVNPATWREEDSRAQPQSTNQGKGAITLTSCFFKESFTFAIYTT